MQEKTRDLLSKLDSQTMQKLGQEREAQFREEVQASEAQAQSGLEGLRAQIDALDMIEENFSSFDHYEQFTAMLDAGELSPAEVDGFLDAVSSRRSLRNLKAIFEEQGLPVNRESYTLLADRFGLPTSTTEVLERTTDSELENFDRLQEVAAGLESIPSGISSDLDQFRLMLGEA